MRICGKLFLVRIALFLLIAVVGLLLVPSVSTILTPRIDGDYSVFSIVGRGWLNGEVPYLKYFDHKGPLMMLIQVIGQSIEAGKWGIWILEILFAVISFELLYRIGVAVGASRAGNIIAMVISIIFYFAYIDGGNSVEEWSLPFELLPLLLVVKYLKGDISRVRVPSLITGICFGAVAMIRINNNCIICGLAVALLIIFIIRRQYKELLQCILFFFIGVCVSVLPFIIYFAYYKALDDLFFSCYIFPMLYKKYWYSALLKLNITYLSPCFILPVIAWFYNSSKENKEIFILAVSVSLITFLTFIDGADYYHYFTLVLPIIALSLQLSFNFKVYQKTLIIIFLLLPLKLSYAHTINSIMININHDRFMEARGNDMKLKAGLIQLIPEQELDSIYCSGSFAIPSCLYHLGHLPAGKYFVIQGLYSNFGEPVISNIYYDFKNVNPKWVISTDDILENGILSDRRGFYREIPADSLPEIFVTTNHRVYIRK